MGMERHRRWFKLDAKPRLQRFLAPYQVFRKVRLAERDSSEDIRAYGGAQRVEIYECAADVWSQGLVKVPVQDFGNDALLRGVDVGVNLTGCQQVCVRSWQYSAANGSKGRIVVERAYKVRKPVLVGGNRTLIQKHEDGSACVLRCQVPSQPVIERSRVDGQDRRIRFDQESHASVGRTGVHRDNLNTIARLLRRDRRQKHTEFRFAVLNGKDDRDDAAR